MGLWETFSNEGPESEREGSAPWETEGDLDFLDDSWPEYLAGPEYWLHKKRLEEGEDHEDCA